MRHLVAGFFALVFLLAAGAVIWLNKSHIGLAEMAFSGGFVLLAAGLLVPMDLGKALSPLTVVVKLARGEKVTVANDTPDTPKTPDVS